MIKFPLPFFLKTKYVLSKKKIKGYKQSSELITLEKFKRTLLQIRLVSTGQGKNFFHQFPGKFQTFENIK